MAKIIILFNKQSGEYFGTTYSKETNQIDSEFLSFKEFEFDPTTHIWDGGDIINGKVIAISEAKPEVKETNLNQMCEESISKEYPLYKQLNIISDVLNDIIQQNNLSGESIDRFKKIHDFIGKKRLLNARYKNAYKNNPEWDYISKEDEEELNKKILKGGLYERINDL
jgi:hypothetical protein